MPSTMDPASARQCFFRAAHYRAGGATTQRVSPASQCCCTAPIAAWYVARVWKPVPKMESLSTLTPCPSPTGRGEDRSGAKVGVRAKLPLPTAPNAMSAESVPKFAIKGRGKFRAKR